MKIRVKAETERQNHRNVETTVCHPKLWVLNQPQRRLQRRRGDNNNKCRKQVWIRNLSSSTTIASSKSQDGVRIPTKMRPLIHLRHCVNVLGGKFEIKESSVFGNMDGIRGLRDDKSVVLAR